MLYLTKGEEVLKSCDCNDEGFSYVDCDCSLYAETYKRNVYCEVDEATNKMFYYEEVLNSDDTIQEINKISDTKTIERLKIILMGFFII